MFPRIAVACLMFSSVAAAQSPTAPDRRQPPPTSPPVVVETVDVVAVTPLHGSGVPRLHIPANVQVIPGSDGASGATDLAALLTRGMATLHASDVQGGTFQPDVLFRGFGGSPLLGASEGLAVYLDGVRANEPFGDIVNWDALPPGAIANVNVMAGSNPLFGLNALGGAISVRTRDGFQAPGGRVAVTGGAFGRYRADGEAGGARGAFAGLLAGSVLDEDGWRDESPSTLRRLFAKGSARTASTHVDVATTVAANSLAGNGTAPERLLAERRQAVFTHPDRTDHDLGALTARVDHFASPTLRLETMAYVRQVRLGTLNGDAGDDDHHGGGEDDDDDDDDDGDDAGFDAALNRSRTRSRSGGATIQLVHTRPLLGRSNHAVAGAAIDDASSDFEFSTEFGRLSPTREALGAGVYDEDAAVALDADTRTLSAFVTDTIDLVPALHLTASARFNRTTVRLRDRIGTDLDGDHVFSRVNPSIGATWDVLSALNVYASYAQSSRAPTAVELTCADPDDPCRLPNAFVSDPPLNQPVAGTWEAGARGVLSQGSWLFSAFTTRVDDDLIFVSSGRLRGTGHFENVARTHRRGIEAGGEWRVRAVTLSGTYTWQRATFGGDFAVPSAFHPAADGGQLQVRANDRLPGVPSHVARIGLATRLGDAVDVAGTWRAQSSQVMRGDEGNLLAPVAGFAVVDAHARWRLARRLAVIAQVANLFDSEYATFGMLGDAGLLGEAYEDEPRFVSPGAPRAGWVGLEVRF